MVKVCLKIHNFPIIRYGGSISQLQSEFSMTNLGLLHHFLGVHVTRDSHGLFLSQRQCILELLDKASMTDCQPSRTPVDTSSELSASGEPFSDATLS
jgi:histone deacetylase 1/2